MVKVIKRQHKAHVQGRKLRLRKALVEGLNPGAAYVPFIGDADLPVGAYPDRLVYGVDLDPERIATAGERLASAVLQVGNCEKGWPLTGDLPVFAICDADAYTWPYGAVRAFLDNAELAPWVAIFGTDGVFVLRGMHHFYWNPDGGRSPVTKRNTHAVFATHWNRTVKPWLASRLAGRGYVVEETRKTKLSMMLYWGVLARRA